MLIDVAWFGLVARTPPEVARVKGFTYPLLTVGTCDGVGKSSGTSGIPNSI
jgi:hypothetical protein